MPLPLGMGISYLPFSWVKVISKPTCPPRGVRPEKDHRYLRAALQFTPLWVGAGQVRPEFAPIGIPREGQRCGHENAVPVGDVQGEREPVRPVM